jgi:hypothetical protein
LILADSANSLLAMALWNVEWLVKTEAGMRSRTPHGLGQADPQPFEARIAL